MTEKLIDITGGYGTVYKAVMKNPELSIEAKAIYSYLATYAGGKEIAFPSIKLICHELNISEKRFYKHRKELIEKEIISTHRERTDNGFSKTIYTINHHFVHSRFVHVRNDHGQNDHGQNVGTKNNSIKNNNNKNNNSKKDTVSESLKHISNELEMIQSPLKIQEIEELIKNLGNEALDIVKVATDYTRDNNKGINYLIKVLTNWIKEDVDTKEKAENKVKPKKQSSNIDGMLDDLLGSDS